MDLLLVVKAVAVLNVGLFALVAAAVPFLGARMSREGMRPLPVLLGQGLFCLPSVYVLSL